MSRCFPFPPPGYTLSSARKETMIELIKLHKEKQQKKEKRREKKERRKERRERRRNKKDKTNPNPEKSDIVKGQQVCSYNKDAKIERSSLTEDCLPVPTSSCDSTENTNNSKKRDDTYGHSEAIFTRVISLMESQHEGDTGLRKRQEISSINLRNNGEEIWSIANDDMQGVELRYKDLVENLLPPAGLQDTSFNAVDSDWLFLHDEKRRKCGSSNVSSCRSGGLWACAEYLPQGCVVALPFVIPY